MSRRIGSIDRNYFDDLYATNPDPWQFATSDYEREKYAASLAALPDERYQSGLEVGCSIGIFTRELAARCESLLALDVADAALAQAMQHCDLPNVTFENRSVPTDWPKGEFDLMVLSEVLYYLDLPALVSVAQHVEASLSQGGIVLLVHYLGETDYPITGDEAASIFIRTIACPTIMQSRTASYRLDVLRK